MNRTLSLSRRRFLRLALASASVPLLGRCESDAEGAPIDADSATAPPSGDAASTAPPSGDTASTAPPGGDTATAPPGGDPASTSPRVVVVGAGISGLVAAKTLHDAGVTVRVIEAQDRLGGRLWTDRSVDGVPLDLGASWIHGISGNKVYDFVKGLGLATVPFDYDNDAVYRPGGVVLSDAEQAAYEARFDALEEGLDTFRKTRRGANAADMSLGAAIEQVIESMSLGANETRDLRNAVNTSIEHEYASPVSALSLYNFDSAADLEGDDVLLPGGWDKVVEALASALPDVRKGSPVSHITVGNDGVRVSTADGDHSAEFAICTVPLGVLKKGAIAFSPPLDADKQRAITRLTFGILDKLYLKFETPFWDEEKAELIDFIDTTPGRWAEHLNFSRKTGKPFLLSFNAGDYATENAALTDDEVVSRAMVALRSMFGDAVPAAPLAFRRSNWSHHPYTFGSYTSMGVGATPADIEAFEEPHEDRLYLAGEHTSAEKYQTLQGAYESGLAAAKAVLTKLGATQRRG